MAHLDLFFWIDFVFFWLGLFMVLTPAGETVEWRLDDICEKHGGFKSLYYGCI